MVTRFGVVLVASAATLGFAVVGADGARLGDVVMMRGGIPESFPTEVAVPVGVPIDLGIAFPSWAEQIVDGRSSLWVLPMRGGSEIRPLSAAQFAPDIDQRGRAQLRGVVWWLFRADPADRGKDISLLIRARRGDKLSPPVSLHEQTDRYFQFAQGLRKVLQLNHQTVRSPERPERYSTADFIHPLWGLDGERITQSFPKDHLHHRGLFWAWPRVMRDGKSLGDLWHLKQIGSRFGRVLWRRQGPVFAEVALENRWVHEPLARGSEKVVVEHLTVRVFPADEVGQCIDVELALRALQAGISIGGKPDKNKGYGGFTLRLDKPAEGQIRMDGERIAKDVDRRRARWSDYSGRFRAGGPASMPVGRAVSPRALAPSTAGTGPSRPTAHRASVSGVAVFAHPTIPDYPPGWTNRYYGILNPAFPGLASHEVPQGEPLRLRFRVYVHRHDCQRGRVGDQYQGYVADFGWQGAAVPGSGATKPAASKRATPAERDGRVDGRLARRHRDHPCLTNPKPFLSANFSGPRAGRFGSCLLGSTLRYSCSALESVGRADARDHTPGAIPRYQLRRGTGARSGEPSDGS